MAILNGALTVRRFRVVGDLPEGWRETYRDALQSFAFREPPEGILKEEVEGWVQVHNLLDTDFTDYNRWLYNDFVLVALRVDKKSLPAKLFNAHLAKECEKWCASHEQSRCPLSMKTEIRERMESEWLRRTLPRVSVTEAAWNLTAGYVVVHSLAEATAERVRKRFFRTFGVKLVPWSPLDWLDSAEAVQAMVTTAPSNVQVHWEADNAQ